MGTRLTPTQTLQPLPPASPYFLPPLIYFSAHRLSLYFLSLSVVYLSVLVNTQSRLVQ